MRRLLATLALSTLLVTTSGAEQSYSGVGGFIVRYSYLSPEPEDDFDLLDRILKEMNQQGGILKVYCNLVEHPKCYALPGGR
jgi:hypothetical protein